MFVRTCLDGREGRGGCAAARARGRARGTSASNVRRARGPAVTMPADPGGTMRETWRARLSGLSVVSALVACGPSGPVDESGTATETGATAAGSSTEASTEALTATGEATGGSSGETDPTSGVCEPVVPIVAPYEARRIRLASTGPDAVGSVRFNGPGFGSSINVHRPTGLNPALELVQSIGTQDAPPAWGDVDGDGRTDLVLFEGGTRRYFRSDGAMMVLAGSGPGDTEAFSTQVADANGDGKGDLFQTPGQSLVTWTGDGAGGFTAGAPRVLAGPNEVGLLYQHAIDPHGRLAVMMYYGPSCDFCTTRRIVTLVNDGAGLTNPAPAQEFGLTFSELQLADLDADDVPEVVVQSEGGNVFALEMSAPGVLSTRFMVPGSVPRVGDVDGDGRTDLLVADGDHISIYSGADDYAVGTPVTVAGIGEPQVVLVAELDGDGIDDYVVSGMLDPLVVLVRSGCG